MGQRPPKEWRMQPHQYLALCSRKLSACRCSKQRENRFCFRALKCGNVLVPAQETNGEHRQRKCKSSHRFKSLLAFLSLLSPSLPLGAHSCVLGCQDGSCSIHLHTRIESGKMSFCCLFGVISNPNNSPQMYTLVPPTFKL